MPGDDAGTVAAGALGSVRSATAENAEPWQSGDLRVHVPPASRSLSAVIMLTMSNDARARR